MFPLADQIGDQVENLLTADATTSTVSWTRGEMVYDDPLQVPATDAFGDMVPLGFILVHEIRMEPKFMGGLNASQQNLSAYLGRVPVQMTLVARSETKDTQAARRKCEDMLTNVFRVVCGGDVTLGGRVMHIDNISARTDAIPKQGVAWATALIEYRFIAAPI